MTSAENKGSGVPTSFGKPSSPEPSRDVCMEATADKRTREPPDTTTRPEGKLFKTSGESSSSQRNALDQVTFDIDMSVDPVEQTGCAKQQTGNRKLANNAPEARLLIRQMHARVQAWKLQPCVQALSARPIDLAYIAEVTDILFASEELVSVSAKCSADLARESNVDTSVDQLAGSAGATSLSSDIAGGESLNVEPNSKGPSGPEGTTAQSHAQSAKDKSSAQKSGEEKEDSPRHDSSAVQCATAQDSAQQTPQPRLQLRVPQHQKVE